MRYAPDEITGYHGCSREAAERILAGDAFIPSNNAYDWLGRGVYFWEYAPVRAQQWAVERYGDDAAVLEATIRLGNCLNLLDTRHLAQIVQYYQILVAELERTGVPLPRNTGRGAHFLDRWVIDRFCQFAEKEESVIPFQTVRGCFPEGEPLSRIEAVAESSRPDGRSRS